MSYQLHLVRSDDPETSALAANSLDLELSDRHQRVLHALVGICPATDLEMAIALSQLGHGREESCRRIVRTLREEHGRLVPALDANGQQVRHLNPTGRWAECWVPGYSQPPVKPDPAETPAERLARCVPVWEDEVEHVMFDGVVYYMAHDLLEALTRDAAD